VNLWLLFALLMVPVVVVWLTLAVWDDVIDPGISEWYDSQTDTWHPAPRRNM
jgi:hypothetical protein